jgi:thiol-disulfide isomerase/thioredoxin
MFEQILTRGRSMLEGRKLRLWTSLGQRVTAMLIGPISGSCVPALSDIGTEQPTLTTQHGRYVVERRSWFAGEMALRTGEGGATHFGAFRGKIVLLNFWASWCAPCVTEMPALDRLQAALGSSNFMVVAVSIERNSLERTTAFYQQYALRHLAIFTDESSSVEDGFKLAGLPTSYIVDPDGRVRGYISGAVDWDSESERSLIRYYTQ